MTQTPSVLVVEDDENLRVALRDNLEDEKLALSQIANREAILDSIKEFLGKGK